MNGLGAPQEMAEHLKPIRLLSGRDLAGKFCVMIQAVVFIACVFAAGRIWSLHIFRPETPKASVVRSDPNEHYARGRVCIKKYPEERCCD